VSATSRVPEISELLSDADPGEVRSRGEGPPGRVPLTAGRLREAPSGDIFGLTQNAGMGWAASEAARTPYLILSTHGGLRESDGRPVALGYHTGHWEVGLLVRAAAEAIRDAGGLPFAAYCTDPCDGRTQGTPGMMDSLPYRNDAAIVMRRQIRSLPGRAGVLGVATCDKGLPATMLALAGCRDLPGVIVPGGVTLPAVESEDAGAVQTLGARFAHGLVGLDEAAALACRACGSPGGGCQFLGTAATAQVVGEALGLSLPHSALAPSGQPVWLDMARRSALALLRLAALRVPLGRVLTSRAVENALLVHAAFGGSTNLVLHLPAIAHAAGLRAPSVADWQRASRATPRLVDALPNGPRNHPTVRVFLAGGVPEVLLHLRRMGLVHGDVLTATGETLDGSLDWWEASARRRRMKERLREADGIDADEVIMDADSARRRGLAGAAVFPVGNLAPGGAVVKATAIDPSVVEDEVYRHRGPARVFTSEAAAVAAIKGLAEPPVRPGDVVVMAGLGPRGTGMEETYQVTSALKFLPWGKQVAVLTDARFSGVSTGACIGHVSPEALAGGPIGKLRDGDVVEIVVDRRAQAGRVDLVGTARGSLTAAGADRLLARRSPHPGLAPRADLPADTKLWAALQEASGGIWAGCVYDPDRIAAALGERRRRSPVRPLAGSRSSTRRSTAGTSASRSATGRSSAPRSSSPPRRRPGGRRNTRPR
jgi:putative YjhG/YagF family dehydratase